MVKQLKEKQMILNFIKIIIVGFLVISKIMRVFVMNFLKKYLINQTQIRFKEVNFHHLQLIIKQKNNPSQ